MSAGGLPRLLERDAEVALIDQALTSASAGDGAVLLVQGPPGIGKTELLQVAIAHARDLDMEVLQARGGELERSFPYGIARQLFEPALAAADPAARGELLAGPAAHVAGVVDASTGEHGPAADPSVVLHGLYWLTANAAARRPLLLVADDAHWADAASVAWLTYLARRMDGLPAVVAVGARPVEPGVEPGLLDPLREQPGVGLLQPAPLSLAAVERLCGQALGQAVEPAFAAACHDVTGGNPFYVSELLRTLKAEGVRGASQEAATINRLTPQLVTQATLGRLGRMSEAVRQVAVSVAMLEPHSQLGFVAELAEIDVATAADAADTLFAAGLLVGVDPCRFAHPILHAAVEQDIRPAQRGLLHACAAKILEAAALPMESVAAHLIQSPATGDQATVAALRRAATEASAAGAPLSAVDYLGRALNEPPDPAARFGVLLELGRAESAVQVPTGIDHLRDALELAQDPDNVAAAGLALGHALVLGGAFDAATEALLDARGRLDGHRSPQADELRGLRLYAAGTAGVVHAIVPDAEALAGTLDSDSPALRTALSIIALDRAVSGVPRREIRPLLDRALAAGGPLLGPGGQMGRDAPIVILLFIDYLDEAERLYSDALERAAEVGSPRLFAYFSASRSYLRCVRGDLSGAAQDVEPAFAGAEMSAGPDYALLLALVSQVTLLTERGEAAAAEQLAAGVPIPPAFEEQPLVAALRQVQGVAQLAQHRLEDAATTFRAVGATYERRGGRSPIAPYLWRSGLALALAGLGRVEEGLDLAREEQELAELAGLDRGRGVALRARGLLEGGEDGLHSLDQSVSALERSPARLELGRSLCELGAALRRAKRRRDAREPLDRALDLAMSCGSLALAERTREELAALGARPRSIPRSGVEALTPSELRVCRLAAQGLKNVEIAQALFVTPKTVETHLGSAYRKLGINSRADLGQALAPAP